MLHDEVKKFGDRRLWLIIHNDGIRKPAKGSNHSSKAK